LHDDCDVVIAHDDDPQAARAFAAEAGIARWTTDYDELLHSGVDFVVLTGSMEQRLARVTAAAEQGAHVLVQAPMAADLATAEAMLATCERAGVRLGVAVPWLADPILEQVRRMVADDWLGGLAAVQALSASDGMLRVAARPSLHPFLDGGASMVHLISWLTGRSAERVTAQVSRMFSPNVDDTGVATLALRGNVMATLTTSHVTAMQSFALHGTDGGVRLGGDRVWLRGRHPFRGEVFDYPQAGVEIVLARGDLAGPLAAAAARSELLGRFARWLEDRDDFPCPGDQAVADMRVVDALLRAARTGTTEQP
jgi:predicted dehydrogenase